MYRCSRLILGVFLAVMASCHRTAPQQPTQRSSSSIPDIRMMGLLQVNQSMANEADKVLLQMADSLHKATGTEFAQMPCGGWKSRRDSVAREKSLYAETPQLKEKWRVRFKTMRLDGTLVSDTEGVYTIRTFELPIAIEDAVAEMYSGEKVLLLAPWYTAYGIHGNGRVAGYENVLFEVTLGEKTADSEFTRKE